VIRTRLFVALKSVSAIFVALQGVGKLVVALQTSITFCTLHRVAGRKQIETGQVENLPNVVSRLWLL